ncbi:MAG: YggS family pyridoxal phosphate-dependent enzyme [Elusimicrobia bacterium]|nr:YggS family pyridoxal phosphate-dependent enzyme [Elusimicrobiota bacterium]
MNNSGIKEKVNEILEELPPGVKLVAACKTRTPKEITAAVKAGIKILGQNYIQESEDVIGQIPPGVKWHFIGHLQRNKAKKAVHLFDMIESLDSLRLAKKLNKESRNAGKITKCLVEINSGRENNKDGILPKNAEEAIRAFLDFKNLKIEGLMTMGPFAGTPEDFRPYFKTTKEIFESLKSKNIKNCDMKYLSMGMSASYRVAVEEGANIVRIGTKLFGPREK